MKPYPFVWLNHFTVPVGIGDASDFTSLYYATDSRSNAPTLRVRMLAVMHHRVGHDQDACAPIHSGLNVALHVHSTSRSRDTG